MTTESVIEKLFREAAAGNWWPELPLVQEHWVRAGGQKYRIDFAVLTRRFGVELDGHATHSTPTAIAKDRRRQRALERDGWTICRFGGQEVTRSAANCVWEARSALSGLISESASAADRTWFSEHPHAYEYRRAHIPGELPVVYASGARTLVRKTSWGRARYTEGTILADQPPTTDLKMLPASEELLKALDADCADARNAVLDMPRGTLVPADHTAVIVPADLALSQDRAVKAMLDGEVTWFVPDTVARRMEQETKTPLPAGPALRRADGRELYLMRERP